ncbi:MULTISPECIES: hypothetical protein [Hyphobacterium]|uniref:Uncharacterized protein n=1 Tax=Hyphobacterium vulgare TaxID=1736751 RepID=A0ABV6ZWZ3_9PROT
MNDNSSSGRTRFSANHFAGGVGGGGLLFLILSLATGNPVLGVLFGLLPGVAIGLWLALTSRD